MRILFLLLFCAPSWAARWIATSPQTAELLFQLGAGRDVVGRVEGSVYPPEAEKAASIGQMFSPGIEKTVALRPDWVILDTHTLNPGYVRAVQAQGISTFTWDTTSVESLLSDMERWGKTVGRDYSAPATKWRACLQSLRGVQSEKKFLGFVWQEPPILLGPTSFLSRLLEHIGWRNLVPAKFRIPYVSVTSEWLVATRPDRIFEIGMGTMPRAAFPWWAPNPAVQFLDMDLFARASLTPLKNLKHLVARVPASCEVVRER